MSTEMTNVAVPSSLIEKLKQYSDLSGQPVQGAITEALEDFINTTAEARAEFIVEKAKMAAQA